MQMIMFILRYPLIGLPTWGWMFIVGVIAVEGKLGRSKNPKFRSIADASHTFLATILKPTVGKIPGLGPLVTAILDALDPTPDEPAAAPPAAAAAAPSPTSEEITHPEPVPPPKPKRGRSK